MKANGNEVLNEVQKCGRKKSLESLFSEVLVVMGFEKDDPQLKDTPRRMAKMYIDELFAGCYTPEPKLTMFPNDNYHSSEGFVFLGPIEVKSMCSHHFLPFTGSVYIGYVPGEMVVGISKLSRVVNWFMRRPQIQEEFTSQLCTYLSEKLEAKDLIVHCEASHMCMTLRGVQQPMGSIMATTSNIGRLFSTGQNRSGFFDQVTRSKI